MRCGICEGDQDRRVAIDRLIAAGRASNGVERSLRGLYAVKAETVTKHRRHWLGVLPTADADVYRRIAQDQGPRADLASLIVDEVRESIEDGVLKPGIGAGLAAQRIIDHREERQQDRQLAIEMAKLLSGGSKAVPRAIIDVTHERLPEQIVPLADPLRGHLATARPQHAKRTRDTTAEDRPR